MFESSERGERRHEEHLPAESRPRRQHDEPLAAPLKGETVVRQADPLGHAGGGVAYQRHGIAHARPFLMS